MKGCVERRRPWALDEPAPLTSAPRVRHTPFVGFRAVLRRLRSRSANDPARAERLASMRQNEDAPNRTGDPVADSFDEISRIGRFSGPGRGLEAEFKPPRDY